MTVVNKFNVNNKQVTLDADIIENMSANDVSYDDSYQYDENTVGDKLSELEQQIIGDTQFSLQGYINANDGEFIVHSSFRATDFIPIGKGCKITYRLGSSGGVGVAFYGENKDYNTKASLIIKTPVEGVITVPANIYYVRFCYYTIYTGDMYALIDISPNNNITSQLNDYKTTVESALSKKADKTELDLLKTSVSGQEIKEGHFYYTLDNITAKEGVGTEYYCAKYKVKPGLILRIIGKGNASAKEYIFVDASMNVIAASRQGYPDIKEHQYDGVIVPDGSEYCLVNGNNLNGSTTYPFVQVSAPKQYYFGIDSFIDEDYRNIVPTVSYDSSTQVTITFNTNPKVRLLNGYTAYLFPQDSQEYKLTLPKQYTAILVKRDKFLKVSWQYTPYLSASDLELKTITTESNFEGYVIIAYLETRDRILNVGCVGHLIYDQRTRTIPSLNSRVTNIEEEISSEKLRIPSLPYYGNLIKEKCPNFYSHMLLKDKDVVVCLTGTSLSQGNLYAGDYDNHPENRPPLLHSKDLASHIFDKLITFWDGQHYLRYDHSDLSYSDSSWSVTNNLLNNEESIWDDRSEYKNGLTKTTRSSGASVSTEVPAQAWRFNFIYRTDSLGGNCKVEITEGDGNMEVFNGSTWVEANNYTFTMLEPAATATKGNTIYQKRLNFRCRDKQSGRIDSIGTIKHITISKVSVGDETFNVVGFEWSYREFMFTFINAARGSHQWGVSHLNLEDYQDGDIWEFNPDLIMMETTVINWGASYLGSTDVQSPMLYAQRAFDAYFNENRANSIYMKSNKYIDCEILFYGDTWTINGIDNTEWNSDGSANLKMVNKHLSFDDSWYGLPKCVYDNWLCVDKYMQQQNYIYIPVLNIFRNVAMEQYGSIAAAFKRSGKNGDTLTYDTTHLNTNGAKLWASRITPLFDLF